MQYRRSFAILSVLASLMPGFAAAHASEQGFVLLLPTEFYTGVGVVSVVLTLLALVIVPRWAALGIFSSIPVRMPKLRRWRMVAQMMSAILLILLIWIGLVGPRDPLSNPLVLMVWVVFWIGFVVIQGLFFDAWSVISPFKGMLRWARLLGGSWRFLRLPRWVGSWPALVGFIAFGYVMLADPKPADPGHLARLVGVYTLVQMSLILLFGPRWLARCEVFTMVMQVYGKVSIIGNRGFGVPGWRIVGGRTAGLSVAVLCVVILATGSFDGLNETFWWLGLLGMNPLEFSGRSAVQWQNTAGMIVANLSLLGIFALSVWLGQWLARVQTRFLLVFCAFAPTLLPIALGYHVAHYLPSFLVDSQYALVALSDPLMIGADILGLGDFYVTTGFFNSTASVRVMYLTQAIAVGLGHILAVLVAHAVALQLFGSHKSAILSQLPLAVFMVAYTFFGLWLLASPRF